MYIIWLLYLIIIIYNALDLYQTLMLLEVGAKEINPIVNWFISKFGILNGILIAKSLPILILGFGLYKYQLNGQKND